LGAVRFAAKTPVYDYWISLDFLGFSRANRDFSMGYADFLANFFSDGLVCRETLANFDPTVFLHA
jgi:hypothetical protein